MGRGGGPFIGFWGPLLGPSWLERELAANNWSGEGPLEGGRAPPPPINETLHTSENWLRAVCAR